MGEKTLDNALLGNVQSVSAPRNSVPPASALPGDTLPVSVPPDGTLPAGAPFDSAPCNGTHQWPAMEYETLPWEYDPDAMALVPKAARRKIRPTYQAAIPLFIAERDVAVPADLLERIAEVTANLARFDAQQAARGYNLPALLLRSESAASSQIENLTSSVRNVALAELSDQAPRNAQVIMGNVAAMRAALSLPDQLSAGEIKEVHRALMNRAGQTFGGRLREEPVWVGGRGYSPHGALFVPPAFARVPAYLEDIVAYAQRENVNPVVKAAVVHAQFETVHPFIDGNGRCGRTLVHKLLRAEGVLRHATLPVSAGLLHDVDAYMASIREYQAGNPLAIIEQVTAALEMALVVGGTVARHIDSVVEAWREGIQERAGSHIHKLPDVLVEQPVVDSRYVSEALGITRRAALAVIGRACDYGMLRPMGNRRRGEFYQSDELINVLEDVSSLQGIRRVLATGKV